MDFENIEALYSPSHWSKRYSEDEILVKFVSLITEGSNEVKVKIPNTLNTPYGSFDRQKFDIYGTDLPDGAPIFIFIHGGYWQMESINHEISGFMMNTFHKNGFKGITIGYELCPRVSLQEIIDGIQTAFLKILDYVKASNSKSLVICGHSVGAHLAASLFESFIPNWPIEDQNLIKAVFLMGGIYDLFPLLDTSYNEPLKLTPETAKQFSPMFHKISAPAHVKFYVVVGENDSPKFVEQSKEFHEKLLQDGINSSLTVLPDTDHFDCVENFTDEKYVITKNIFDSIK